MTTARTALTTARTALAATLWCAASLAAQAAPVTSYAFTYVDVPGPTGTTRHSDAAPGGTAAAVARAGTDVHPWGVRVMDYDAAARADLASGELKLKAVQAVTPGALAYTRGPGVSQTGISAWAEFGDSFRTRDGTGPFAWDAERATFRVDLTGSRLASGLTIPAGDRYAPGASRDLINTYAVLQVFKPGTLDLWYRLVSLAEGTPFAEFAALSRLVGDATLSQTFAAITDTCCGWTTDLSIPVLPGSADLSFAPGGDFDWAITLRSDITIDLASQTARAGMDLMNTARIGYRGPAGTTTYSASGVFPGTRSLDDLPAGVPEPGTALLALTAVAWLVRRRPAAHAAA